MTEKSPLLPNDIGSGQSRYPKRRQSTHQRYQSSVIHLPKDIVNTSIDNDNIELAVVSNNPLIINDTKDTNDNKDDNGNDLPVTKPDSETQKQSPHGPQNQLVILWFNIALFAISIIFGIGSIIIENSLIFSSPILIIILLLLFISSILGLLLSYSYRKNMENILKLNKKLLNINLKFNQINNSKQQDDDNQLLNQKEKVSLLTSFRRGDFHKQLGLCSSQDLKELIPVVAQTLCQLPFGLTELRTKLFVILASRISTDASLDQQWRFFLNSYKDIPSIIETWENHAYLKDIDDDEKQKSLDDKPKQSAINSVKFFRSLFTDLDKLGSRKSIDPNQFLCDPINGNILIQVQLRKIMPSNASPYLIDNYTSDKSSGYPILSSKMLLKKGDDLRKDLGIMLMCKFMNELWKENNIKYNNVLSQTLIYNVIPMSKAFGAIEYIENANKIANIDEIMKNNLKFSINKLIATAAASYISSYIMGVRDRHHDNILLCSDGTFFQIDFSYILGEKLSGLDASRIAISKKFVKLLGDSKWNDFLDLVIKCYIVLRNNYIELLDYSRIVFGFMKRTKENSKYLRESLLIDIKDEKEVIRKIKTLFIKAPKELKTKVKNVIHSLAVKKKSHD